MDKIDFEYGEQDERGAQRFLRPILSFEMRINFVMDA